MHLQPLIDLSNKTFSEKEWLLKYVELYKTTLNWPEGLPPIRRSNLEQNSLMKSFHEQYDRLLNEFEYIMDHSTQSITIWDKKMIDN